MGVMGCQFVLRCAVLCDCDCDCDMSLGSADEERPAPVGRLA